MNETLTEAVKKVFKNQIDPSGIFKNTPLFRHEIEITSSAKSGMKKYKSDKTVASSLTEVTNYLAHNQHLPSKYNNHTLTGSLQGYMDCHLKGSQILLVYRLTKTRIILFYVGDHKGLSAAGKRTP